MLVDDGKILVRTAVHCRASPHMDFSLPEMDNYEEYTEGLARRIASGETTGSTVQTFLDLARTFGWEQSVIEEKTSKTLEQLQSMLR